MQDRKEGVVCSSSSSSNGVVDAKVKKQHDKDKQHLQEALFKAMCLGSKEGAQQALDLGAAEYLHQVDDRWCPLQWAIRFAPKGYVMLKILRMLLSKDNITLEALHKARTEINEKMRWTTTTSQKELMESMAYHINVKQQEIMAKAGILNSNISNNNNTQQQQQQQQQTTTRPRGASSGSGSSIDDHGPPLPVVPKMISPSSPSVQQQQTQEEVVLMGVRLPPLPQSPPHRPPPVPLPQAQAQAHAHGQLQPPPKLQLQPLLQQQQQQQQQQQAVVGLGGRFLPPSHPSPPQQQQQHIMGRVVVDEVPSSPGATTAESSGPGVGAGNSNSDSNVNNMGSSGKNQNNNYHPKQDIINEDLHHTHTPPSHSGHEGILLKKLLFSKEFSDVRFEFSDDNQILYANKQILAAACPAYFNKTEFANATTQGQEGGVIVFRPEASYEVIKAVLSFVYTGDLALAKELLLKDTKYHLETIKIADLYKLPRLKEIVAKLMKHSLSPKTLKGCLIASHLYDLPNLKQACYKMIHLEGMSVIFGQPAFLASISKEYPDLWMELAHSLQELLVSSDNNNNNKHHSSNSSDDDDVNAASSKRHRVSY